jgi:hypothetical protein
MIGKKKLNVTDPRSPPPRPEQPRIPFAMLLRMFLIGSIAVGASVWAIWRHYTTTPAPMLVPVPAAAPSSGSSSEIEVEPPP